MERSKYVNKIKQYLKRLNMNEDIEKVREDFTKEFKDVEAREIIRAEQELINEGTPVNEVQRLCDVHASLFHDLINEEKINNTDTEIHKGHPLYTLTRENEALQEKLEKAFRMLEEGRDIGRELEEIREISIHYAKKGDLIYPHLNVKYGIFGPSQVMWAVDVEIRDEMAALSKMDNHDEAWKDRAGRVLKRAEEMIYKEQNILFPMCLRNFSRDEWKKIYKDSMDYAVCLGVEVANWDIDITDEEDHDDKISDKHTDEITGDGNGGNCRIDLYGGSLTVEQLTAILNTIPLEITFVDDKNINCYFNEGPKAFKRPYMAIGREVFTCHPPKAEPVVRAIIEEFRSNRNDSVAVWMEKGGRTMLVTYLAVKNHENKFLGTLEIVQDMEFAKEKFERINIENNKPGKMG